MNRSERLSIALLTLLALIPLACGGVTREPAEATGGSSPTGGASPDTTGGSPPVNVKPTTIGQCTSPTIDPSTHLPKCEEGYDHRPEPVRCTPPPQSADTAAPNPNSCGQDCSQLKNGYCARRGLMPPQCASGCIEDADCAAGSICSCDNGPSPTGGQCVPSTCTIDADCRSGLCASTVEGCGEPRFACQIEADECLSDADCEEQGRLSGLGPGRCITSGDHRICISGSCA